MQFQRLHQCLSSVFVDNIFFFVRYDSHNSFIRFELADAVYHFRPNDHRRDQWIVNSCNEALRKINPGCRRVICEKHFEEKDLRRQFNRTILRREAIPQPYEPPIESLKDEHHGECFA